VRREGSTTTLAGSVVPMRRSDRCVYTCILHSLCAPIPDPLRLRGEELLLPLHEHRKIMHWADDAMPTSHHRCTAAMAAPQEPGL
jgi:hypothetical protein